MAARAALAAAWLALAAAMQFDLAPATTKVRALRGTA